MIWSRWHHGHSLLAGLLFGLLLTHHVWTVAALAFLAGTFTGRLWLVLSELGWRTRAWLAGSKRKRTRW